MHAIRHHGFLQRLARFAWVGALFCSLSAHAIEVDMEITPQVLQLGESAICKIILRDAGRAPRPSLPALPGFDIQGMGTEQSYQFINGQRSAQIAYTYRLTPQAAGEFQVGPFHYDTGSEQITIPAQQIKVLARGATTEDPAQAQQLDDLIFATVSVDSPTIYAQQGFDLTLALYTQPGLNIDGNVSLADFDTTGLSLLGFQEARQNREEVNGRIYDVRRFVTHATALASGDYTLQPKLRVNVIVGNTRNRQRDPFFGDGFFDGFFNRVETRPQLIESRPLALHIKELPTQDRPSSFSGAVGHYAFDVTPNPLTANVGEPITLTLRIQGRGNMDAISAPTLNLSDNFRSYDARLVEQQPSAGLKVFEQVIIPRNMAAAEIPAISFSYFDPARERYETIVRGPFPLALTAAPAGNTAVVQAPGSPPPATTTLSSHDLVYLKTDVKHWLLRDTASTGAKMIRIAVNVVPALALIAVFGYVRRRENDAQNPTERMRRRAPQRARAKLMESRERLNAGDLQGAAARLSDAIATFYGPLLNLPAGRISADDVCRELQTRGLPASTCLTLQEIFSTCEHLRYSNATPNAAGEERKRQVAQHIEQLTDIMRDSRRLLR